MPMTSSGSQTATSKRNEPGSGGSTEIFGWQEADASGRPADLRCPGEPCHATNFPLRRQEQGCPLSH
jgi:hypothetical protein